MYITSKWQTALFHSDTHIHSGQGIAVRRRTILRERILEFWNPLHTRKGRKEGQPKIPSGRCVWYVAGLTSHLFLGLPESAPVQGVPGVQPSLFQNGNTWAPLRGLLAMHTSTSSGHSEGWVGAGIADKLHQGPWGIQTLRNTQGNQGLEGLWVGRSRWKKNEKGKILLQNIMVKEGMMNM